MAGSRNDTSTALEKAELEFDDIVTGMRRVMDELPAADRKRVLTSIRSRWSYIADWLEAPSGRKH
jgi:hypothetical protein